MLAFCFWCIYLLAPILYSEIVDIISNPELTLETAAEGAFLFLWIYAFIAVLKTILRVIQFILLSKFEYPVCKDIGTECLRYLLHNSYKFFANASSGTLNSSVHMLIDGYLFITDELFFYVMDLFLYVPVLLVIVSFKSIRLGIVLLIYASLYGFVVAKVSKYYENQDVAWHKKQNEMEGKFSDIITNQQNVLTFATVKRESKNLSLRIKEIKTIFLNLQKKYAWMKLGMYGLDVLFYVSILLISIYFFELGVFSLGVVVLIEMYTQSLSETVEECVEFFQGMNETLGDATPMLEILKTPHEVVDKSEKKLKVWAGKVEFQDLTFGYSKEVKVFEHFDLRIKPGEKVALVGQSGSGKSTLTKLLFRFYDLFEGKITIDDQDISEVTQESLRSQISLVPQEVILFHRSLGENICYGNPKATKEEMIAACKMARCHDFISKLESWYDTLVGERGIKLSGGERQRVAIARAILENKKILVLDEATSALDSESEVLIQEAMEEVMKNKTCIVIAHRLSTIRKMDKIVVMEKGKILEKGSHQELLNTNGTYAKLWNLQSWGFLGEE